MKQYLILGPPGTGKTTYLLDRVQNEMEDGVHPARIAYVSFTRRAASEAINRALEKFSVQREDFPFFRTLHSLAYQQLNLGREQVMGAAQFKLLGQALGLSFSDYMDFEEGIPVSARNGDQVLFIVSMARATLRTLREQFNAYMSGEVSWFQVKQFADTLASFKAETGMLDFSDMLDHFVTQCPPLDIDVAFIDEAQDLSKQQWQMARHAISRARRVYIAGDDDQAIYRWSGADVDSFLELGGEKKVLQQSYRLPRSIFDFCQTIAGRIEHRFAKTWSPRDDVGSVQHLMSLNEMEIGDGSYLMLGRNKFLLDQLTMRVHSAGIPYTLRGRPIVDPDAVQAIKRWEKLRRGETLTASDARAIYSYMRVNSGFKRGHKKLPGVADDAPITLEAMKAEHGLLREDPWHEALMGIPAEEREFYQAALRRGEKLSTPPRVHINTIHGVKGGEADHVVVLSDMAMRTYNEYQREPEDEHRVAYVAASRARHSLSIVMPQGTRGYPYP